MFSAEYLDEAAETIRRLDPAAIEKLADALLEIRSRGGRLFILGVGGSAAASSHAVNDFRKLAGFEAYTPVDNVSELTARTNDEGWATAFEAWLRGSRLNERDGILILSVGGGDTQVSPNIVRAVDLARERRAMVTGIVGRQGGHTAQAGQAVVIVPTVNPERTTPHAEAFQAVILHLLVSHPKLKTGIAKWESLP